jgi:hypothetical protein
VPLPSTFDVQLLICQNIRKGISHLVDGGLFILTDIEQKNWVINNMLNCLNVTRVQLFFHADTPFSFCGIVDDLPTPVSNTVNPPSRNHKRKRREILNLCLYIPY